jgi:hypothetical protein
MAKKYTQKTNCCKKEKFLNTFFIKNKKGEKTLRTPKTSWKGAESL